MMGHTGKQEYKRFTLGDLVEWTGGVSTLSARNRLLIPDDIIQDSRVVKKNDVFVALTTDRDDGHRYVKDAFKKGAVAALIDKKKIGEFSQADQKKCICVTNPLKAVARAATCYRKAMGILFVGITGSNGKTTTRTFVSSVLRRNIAVGETWSNWNNNIGVPLSILRFKGDEWAGVIEMGANHVGEIHELSRIVQPDIAIITNIGYGHVGLFGSVTKIAQAKFEIADGLNKKTGFMLLNGDDPRLVKGARARKLSAVFYGYGEHCSIRPEKVTVHPQKGVSFDVNGIRYRLQMPGRHFVYSALPAIFIGQRCGVPDEEIVEALKNQKPVLMRGAIESKKGTDFIVDCYNANPSSMKSSLVYLADCAKVTRRAAVIGDMLELGTYSARLHRELGVDIARAGVRKLIAVGKYASLVADAAKKEGVPVKYIFTCKNSDLAADIARSVLKPDDIVLLKGSRGVHLETVFEKF